MTLAITWPQIAELLLLGSCTGFLAGLLGVGGGMMLVPFMTWWLSHQGAPASQVVKMAVATSLATILFTSLSSVRAHQIHGNVRWGVVKLFAPGIVIGSLTGAQLAKALPSSVLAGLFAAFVGFSATQMLLDRKPRATRQLPAGPGMFGAGSLIGVMSALVGAGGAFVSVPFMTWCNVPIRQAVGTAAALGFPIALAGTIGYMLAGSNVEDMPPGTIGFVYLPALLFMASASILTAPLGARTAQRMATLHLKRAFAALLYGLAGYMLLKTLGR